jgi:hypothetical protein
MKLLCDVRKADWRLEITEFSESGFPTPTPPFFGSTDDGLALRSKKVYLPALNPPTPTVDGALLDSRLTPGVRAAGGLRRRQ